VRAIVLGKSTVAEQLGTALRAVVVCLDAINAERGLVSGSGVADSEWVRTHEVSRQRVRAALLDGAAAVVDDTSSPRFLRDGWRELARRAGVPLVLVYVDTPVEVLLARHRANRASHERMDVSNDILRTHLQSYEEPTPDERPVRYDATDGPSAWALEEIQRRLAAGARGE